MYEFPYQFEPLMPSQAKCDALRALSARVVDASHRLATKVHSSTLLELRELVRSMNSYYSNKIEGQGTHPKNIERALHRDFSTQPEIAKLQRLAVAHIEAEKDLEQRVQQGVPPLTSGFVIQAHEALYGRLAPADRLSKEGVAIEPGQLRREDVTVGSHVPPTWPSLSLFLKRFDQAYGSVQSSSADFLIAIACAHHRMTWIHPFLDSNGRASRLQSHSSLWTIGEGLWSVNRGLARDVDGYYGNLVLADVPRQGDLDGRGNLSEKGLLKWVEFFLGVCADQVDFMTELLDFDGMKKRIQALITFRAAHDKEIKMEAVLPLYHMFATGPASRGEFGQMTGLGERSARYLLARLIATGLVVADGKYGPVHFAFPVDALQFLLPDLYPEAAAKV